MALQFKIQLKGITKPPVWRRVVVPGTFTFQRLHEVIQAAFGWWNDHLYQFSPGGYGTEPTISIPSEDDWEPVTDAREVKLSDIFRKKGESFIYIYDFGDNWEHKITLEEVTDEKPQKASCTAGKGACPPEDCGGIWGYEEMKAILQSEPQSDEAAEFRDWLGLEDDEPWDPKSFDVNVANEEVMKV